MVEGKFVIYQLLVRAFGSRECVPGGSFDINGSGKFNDVDEAYLASLKKMSVGAVWFTGVISHATRTAFPGIAPSHPSLVKGEAGSPYAIRDYFDVDPALAVDVERRMDEFCALVERTHRTGMKVIIDFVPNHVARQYKGCFTDENFYLLNGELHLPCDTSGTPYVESPAKATGNNVFSNYPSVTDWYDTVKLNYDNRSTWDKMLNILEFWASKGVDGFRCDMVELVTPDFFSYAFGTLRERYPGLLFIAEVYGKENYRRYSDAGFDYLYDKSGFYDCLRRIVTGFGSASDLTREWQFLGDLQPGMLNFLENHDEQRLASDFFAGDASRSFAALSVSLLFNTAPFMLYFGQEYGERGMEAEGFSGIDGRTSIFDYCTVPSVRRFLDGTLSVTEKRIHREYVSLLKTAVRNEAFSIGKTYDLMYVNPASDHFDPSRTFVWMRGYGRKVFIIAANFSGREVTSTVNIPAEAYSYFSVPQGHSSFTLTIAPYGYSVINL